MPPLAQILLGLGIMAYGAAGAFNVHGIATNAYAGRVTAQGRNRDLDSVLFTRLRYLAASLIGLALLASGLSSFGPLRTVSDVVFRGTLIAVALVFFSICAVALSFVWRRLIGHNSAPADESRRRKP